MLGILFLHETFILLYDVVIPANLSRNKLSYCEENLDHNSVW